MNKIDLDAIALKFIEARPHHTKFMIAKATATEAIRQALILASKNAKIKTRPAGGYMEGVHIPYIDEQSILDINYLII